jgi:hypothetical protein
VRTTIAVTALLAVSCSSSSAGVGPSDGGSDAAHGDGSGGGKLTPDAFVAATAGPGQGDAGACPLSTLTTIFALGTATSGHPTTVQDMTTIGGVGTSVVCTVHPDGSGFDVEVSANAGGPMGGAFSVNAPNRVGAVTASGAQNLDVSITAAASGISYNSTACTLTYTYGGQPVPVSPPIDPGRIWAHISCPAATEGAQPSAQCDVEADFLFEECGQ